MSKVELQEVRARIPELQAALEDQESLQDLHLALGDYLFRRDVIRGVKEDEKIPTLLYPEIIVQLTKGETRALREQAGQAIVGLWKRQGLLGVPIASWRSLGSPGLPQVRRFGVQGVRGGVR